MPADMNGSEDTLAESDDQPQAGTPDASQADAAKPPSATSKQVTIAEDELRKMRSEAQNLRKRLKEIDDKNLTDSDRLKQEHEAATKEVAALKSANGLLAVEAMAAKKGIVDAEAAYLFIEKKIEFDESGKPSNLDELLTDLLKTKPYLKAEQAPSTPPKPSISAAGGDRSQGSSGQTAQSAKDFPRLGQGGLFKNQ